MSHRDKERFLEAIADGKPLPEDADNVSPELLSLSRLGQAFREHGPAAEPAEEPLFTWRQLRVLEEIGQGGFGKVYRAFDPALQRDVALKLGRTDSAGSFSRRTSLVEEARRMARVRHPNVLTIHGAEVVAKQTGIWSELITGETLKDVIDREGPQSLNRSLTIARPLGDALAAIHQAGLIHGDIKPANIMLRDDGEPVLMDFGSGGEAGSPAFSGSPLVMAPELFRGEPLTTATDVYSFGVVLYCLMTGRPPIEASSLEEMAEKQARPVIDGQRLPRRLRALTLSCLATDPSARPTASELVQALGDVAVRPGKLWRALAASVVGVAVISTFLLLADRPPQDEQTSPTAPNSVAVLPLKNLGGNDASQRFSDGLTEEILHQLTRYGDLQVVARSSSFAFRSSDLSLGDLANRLGVRFLLGGSVRQLDDQLRITAFLADSEGRTLWSETFDRTMTNVFSLQTDVAAGVAAQLSASLSSDAPGADVYQPPPAAYQEFLLGREYLRARTPGFENAALGHFNAAIAADPGYAAALAGRAQVFLLAPARSALTEDPWAAAQADIAAALEIDPNESFVLAAQGLLLSEKRQYEAAEQPLRRALRLDPDIAGATTWLSNALVAQGRIKESRELLAAAQQRNPLDPRLATNLADSHSNAGDFEAARELLLRLLDLPNPPQPAYFLLFQLYDRYGRFEELIEAGQSWILAQATLNDEPHFYYSFIAYGYGRLGLFEQAHYWQTRAESIAPVDPGTWARRAFIYRLQGQPENMEAPLRSMIEDRGVSLDRLPGFFANVAGAIRIANGDYAEGITYMERAQRWDVPMTQPPMFVDLTQTLAFAHLKAGNHERADEILKYVEDGLDNLRLLGHGANPEFLKVAAVNKALLGQTEPALDLLTEAYDAGHRQYYELTHDERLQALADHPRFVELLRVMRVDVEAQRDRVLAAESQEDFVARLERQLGAR
ncbi:MAG: protein kinase [Pseudomonadota bacterium]